MEITRPFYLGIYEVTQGQYKQVMGTNPSWFSATGGGKDQVRGLDTRDFPVENLSWYDAVAFCKKLSALEMERSSGRSYRLPTEAEWEYSCREGGSSTTPFHFGATLTSHQANFNGGHPYGSTKGPWLQRTTKVGSFKANALGLYDMHGNVVEWCGDRSSEDQDTKTTRTDPTDPVTNTGSRVVRGGSWYAKGHRCRAAVRSKIDPGNRGYILGFRVVCVSRGESPGSAEDPEPKEGRGPEEAKSPQAKLEKAKEVYKAATEEAKRALLAHFEKHHRELMTAGRTEDATRFEESVEAFRSKGILVGREPELRDRMMEYGQAVQRARDALAVAYHDAIKAGAEARELDRVAGLVRELNILAPDSTLVSLQVYRDRALYLQHGGYLGWVKPAKAGVALLNSTFELVPGLTDERLVSFRSINCSNYYLVHGDFRIRIQPFQNSEGFRKNGTFRRRKGFVGTNTVSFESVNYPGYYIRAKGNKVYIEKYERSPRFRADATFLIAEPLFKFWGEGPP